MIGLRPMRSDSAAEDEEERRAEQQRRGDQQVRRLRVDLQRSASGRTACRTGPVYQTTAWPAVSPNSASSTSFRLPQSAERLRSAAPSTPCPPPSSPGTSGDSLQLQADPHRDAEQHERDEERDAPAPRLERVLAEQAAAAEDHEQREEQPERGRRLDPRRVAAALARRRVLGDVGRRAAVLAAEREALQQPQQDEDDRRRDADRRVASAARRRRTSTCP